MYLTLGSMLSETWPTAEAKPLSRARKSIEATILSLPDDKKLRFLEYPYQVCLHHCYTSSYHPSFPVKLPLGKKSTSRVCWDVTRLL